MDLTIIIIIISGGCGGGGGGGSGSSSISSTCNSSRSAAARLLRFLFQYLRGTWTFACNECCVVSRRCLCDELITGTEESYGLWCVVV